VIVMPRPVSIKDETIVVAAREVFLERGIQATTAEVAARAGVSEGSVFKRFKTKAELFRAAMDDRLAVPSWVHELGARVGKGDVREQLFAIGVDIIGFFRDLMPVMMMAWSNPAPNGLPSVISGPNPLPIRALKQLTGYFEAEMRAGRVARHDPEIMARAFVGSLVHFVFIEVLQRAGDERPLAAETYVRGLVGLLWSGVAPDPAPIAGDVPGRPQ
jgi:AcrR family transcriptional regulator